MPWTHSICGDGKIRTFDECLADRDHQCFDLEIREALYERERNWQAEAHTGTNISVSAIVGCLLNSVLERTIDYAAKPHEKWWSLRGELIHRLVERPDYDAPYGQRRSEMRLFMPVNGTEISGQLDNWRIRFLKEGILKDWKSIGDFGLKYILQEGAKYDHILQTNIYRLMAMYNEYKIDRIVIAYLSLMDVVFTGGLAILNEFLVNEPKPTGFRKNMIDVKKVKEYPSGKKKWACLYRIPEVPILETQWLVEFINFRVGILRDAFEFGQMPMLPRITDLDPKDRKKIPEGTTDIRPHYWKCNGYCPVWKECVNVYPGWEGPKDAET